MSPNSVVERLATIEAEAAQCREEREEHDAKIDLLLKLTHQVHGSIKTLIAVFAIVSTAGGAAVIRYVFDVTSARASSVVISKP